jgi:uncharacterized protein (TIGR00299 family) protein
MHTLLIEPFGGMAGDMFLAACLDLEDPRFDLERLRAFCRVLLGERVSLSTRTVQRGALRATHLSVATPESAQAGGAALSSGAVALAPVAPFDAGLLDPGLVPVEVAFHAVAAASLAPQRGLADLLALAAAAPLSETGRARAARVLRRIAEAEARVHGLSVDSVHFHEIGALDTLVDVCGAVHALECLGVERVVATPPLVGSGLLRCAHGEVPIPAPGTAELLRGIPWSAAANGERTTPTGAALLAEFAASFDVPSGFSAQRIGYGAGTRDPKDGPANALRVQLGSVAAAAPDASSAESPGESTAAALAGSAGAAIEHRAAWLLECNLDDATGEEIGFLLERLRGAGALEAWTQPLSMKKDRPGVLVAALCRAEQRAALEERLWRHSPTLGARWTRVERSELPREVFEIELRGARVRIKRRRVPGRELLRSDLSPEQDDLAALARSTDLPLRELEREALELAYRQAVAAS